MFIESYNDSTSSNFSAFEPKEEVQQFFQNDFLEASKNKSSNKKNPHIINDNNNMYNNGNNINNINGN